MILGEKTKQTSKIVLIILEMMKHFILGSYTDDVIKRIMKFPKGGSDYPIVLKYSLSQYNPN